MVNGREPDDDVAAFVSTGSLPPPDEVRALVSEAHARYRDVDDGDISDVYPALKQVPPEQFGVAVMGTTGNRYGAGDADVEFSIMSVAKPFVFALVSSAIGPETVRRHVWVTPYCEEDFGALAELMGVERILFGSDWPHGEGLAEPMDFVKELDGFDEAAVRRIMRDNALDLLGAS